MTYGRTTSALPRPASPRITDFQIKLTYPGISNWDMSTERLGIHGKMLTAYTEVSNVANGLASWKMKNEKEIQSFQS